MMTIRQIYDQYIYSRSTYCSKETIEKYSDDLRLFFRFLERNYMISVDAAGFDALDQESIYQDYLVYCRNRKIKDSSVRSYARSIKAFLRYCYDEDYCKDYLKKIKMPKSDAAPVLPLFEADVIHIDTLLDREYYFRLMVYITVFQLQQTAPLRHTLYFYGVCTVSFYFKMYLTLPLTPIKGQAFSLYIYGRSACFQFKSL